MFLKESLFINPALLPILETRMEFVTRHCIQSVFISSMVAKHRPRE